MKIKIKIKGGFVNARRERERKFGFLIKELFQRAWDKYGPRPKAAFWREVESGRREEASQGIAETR